MGRACGLTLAGDASHGDLHFSCACGSMRTVRCGSGGGGRGFGLGNSFSIAGAVGLGCTTAFASRCVGGHPCHVDHLMYGCSKVFNNFASIGCVHRRALADRKCRGDVCHTGNKASRALAPSRRFLCAPVNSASLVSRCF